MEKEKAHLVFETWRSQIEILNKVVSLYGQVPESILPYPKEVLEEAINIVGEEMHNEGNFQHAFSIKDLLANHIVLLWDGEGNVRSDRDLLESTKKNMELLLSNQDLFDTTMANLKSEQESWVNSRDKLSRGESK